MNCSLLLAVLCCLSCLQVVQCAEVPLHVEPFDDGYEVAHIALLATSSSVVGVLVCVVLGSLAIRKMTSLANMMLAVVCSAVVVVGVVSWVITYGTMRDEMHEKVQALIILAGDGVGVSILRTLESGVTLGRTYEKLRSYKLTSMNDSYPTPVANLQAVRETFVGKDDAITGVYYGNKWGYTLGGWPIKESQNDLFMYLGYPATAPLDELRHFNCRGWDLENAGCAAVDCATSARLNCGETCQIYNTTNCYSQHTGTSRIIYYTTTWRNGLPSANTTTTWGYEPRDRPWYKAGMAADGEPVWTAPYVFASAENPVPEIGFTYDFAVKTPGTGVNEGVFAVDYNLGSLHTVLLGLLPTKHAVILMCDLDGALYASSSLPDDIALVTVDEDGKDQFEVTNVFTHHRPKIRDVFHDIRRVVGSLNEASQLRRLIQLSDSTLLVSPLNMTGLSLLVVIEVPHEDILEAVNDASTISLAVVLVISVVLAGLVSGLIYVLVSKLEKLSQDMHDVAWMKVDEGTAVSEAGSIVSEIYSMQQSFALLVKNMMEYRQYLPQSLLADTTDHPDEDSGQNSVASSPTEAHLSHMSSRELATSPKHQALFDTVLSSRNISVVCFNSRGTHARLEESRSNESIQHFTCTHGAYLERVMVSAKQTRGVIDYFSGDRVCVMFNAVTSALWHTRRAVDCAILMKGPKDTADADGNKVVAGVSAGHGMCGNAGCHGLKKYCAFGRVVSAAHALVRLAGKLNEDIVSEGTVIEAITHFFTLKFLQRVQLPHDGKPTLACAVVSVRRCQNSEEWMYELAAAENGPYADYNTAVTEMLDGNSAAALQSVEKVTHLREEEVQALKARIHAGAVVPEEPLAFL